MSKVSVRYIVNDVNLRQFPSTPACSVSNSTCILRRVSLGCRVGICSCCSIDPAREAPAKPCRTANAQHRVDGTESKSKSAISKPPPRN